MARTPTTHDPFNAVAEPKRRQVLDAIGAKELSVSAIVDLLGWPQPMVSKHLKVLKQVGYGEAQAFALIEKALQRNSKLKTAEEIIQEIFRLQAST